MEVNSEYHSISCSGWNFNLKVSTTWLLQLWNPISGLDIVDVDVRDYNEQYPGIWELPDSWKRYVIHFALLLLAISTDVSLEVVSDTPNFRDYGACRLYCMRSIWAIIIKDLLNRPTTQNMTQLERTHLQLMRVISSCASCLLLPRYSICKMRCFSKHRLDIYTPIWGLTKIYSLLSGWL